MVAKNQSSEFLDREGAARVLGVSIRSIDRLIDTGALPVGRVGRRIIIRHEDLEAAAFGERGVSSTSYERPSL